MGFLGFFTVGGACAKAFVENTTAAATALKANLFIMHPNPFQLEESIGAASLSAFCD